jgi:hypothetical protein
MENVRLRYDFQGYVMFVITSDLLCIIQTTSKQLQLQGNYLFKRYLWGMGNMAWK